MAEERDTVAQGATIQRVRKDFLWPGGKRVAVIFNIAYEGWSDGKTPGIGPMGNPLPSCRFRKLNPLKIRERRRIRT